MGVVKKSLPPPSDAQEGRVYEAELRGYTITKSTFKDEERERLRLNFILPTGYEASTWLSYYPEPSDRSMLGQLILTIQEVTGKEYRTVMEALEDLRGLKKIYVVVKGFREFGKQLLPNFKIVVDRLPPVQKALTPQPPSQTKLTMEEALKRVQGWPKQQADDYIAYLKDSGQLAPQ